MKKCPFCAEEIQEEAVKCKHCGSMLDGSGQEQKVSVTGRDPLAEFHTPIAGKTKGSLSGLGYIGIALGILMIVIGVAKPGELYLSLIGIGFVVACFLWARTPSSTKESKIAAQERANKIREMHFKKEDVGECHYCGKKCHFPGHLGHWQPPDPNKP